MNRTDRRTPNEAKNPFQPLIDRATCRIGDLFNENGDLDVGLARENGAIDHVKLLSFRQWTDSAGNVYRETEIEMHDPQQALGALQDIVTRQREIFTKRVGKRLHIGE